jgi:hypothetical protein
MKRILGRFVCDNCGKEGEIFEESQKHYPYDDGWVYIYNFKFKLDKNKERGIVDKHFCSKDCMKDFINKELGDKN